MNRLVKIALALVGVFVLLQISSCNKLYDYVFGDDKSAKKCRILNFTQDNIPIGPGTRNAHFYYNNHGDIDSIIADIETGSLGAHRFYFTYGNNHRLIGYREATGPSYPYEEVHTYAYENGRIVRDSVKINPDGDFTEIRTLDYDSWGRIIKETRRILYDDGTVLDDPNVLVFTYDANGNLVLESASYDNGVNFLGTNRHLMFTQRDYSKNNRLGAIDYNQRMLPLGFADGLFAVYGQSSLLSFGLPDEINYSCK